MARITKELAFDSAPPEPVEAEVEVESPAPDETPVHEAAEGEATIPLDAFGGSLPKLGDMLKVTAIDSEGGTVSVRLPMAAKRGGIEAKAAEMDEMDQTPSGLTA